MADSTKCEIRSVYGRSPASNRHLTGEWFPKRVDFLSEGPGVSEGKVPSGRGTGRARAGQLLPQGKQKPSAGQWEKEIPFANPAPSRVAGRGHHARPALQPAELSASPQRQRPLLLPRLEAREVQLKLHGTASRPLSSPSPQPHVSALSGPTAEPAHRPGHGEERRHRRWARHKARTRPSRGPSRLRQLPRPSQQLRDPGGSATQADCHSPA